MKTKFDAFWDTVERLKDKGVHEDIVREACRIVETCWEEPKVVCSILEPTSTCRHPWHFMSKGEWIFRSLECPTCNEKHTLPYMGESPEKTVSRERGSSESEEKCQHPRYRFNTEADDWLCLLCREKRPEECVVHEYSLDIDGYYTCAHCGAEQ